MAWTLRPWVVIGTMKSTTPSDSKKSFWKLAVLISLTVIMIASLAVTIFMFWPRPVDVRIRSFDTRGATIAIRSENLVDYTVKSLIVSIEYEHEKIGELRKDGFVVASRAETIVTLPISSVSLSRGALKGCAEGKQISVQLNIEVDLLLISWTGKKIRNRRTVDIPCGELIKSVLPKDHKKLADQISKMNLSKENLGNIKDRLARVLE